MDQVYIHVVVLSISQGFRLYIYIHIFACVRANITRFYCPGNLSPPSSSIAIVNKNPHRVNDPTTLRDGEAAAAAAESCAKTFRARSPLLLPRNPLPFTARPSAHIRVSHRDPPSKACANSIYTGRTQCIHLLLHTDTHTHTRRRPHIHTLQRSESSKTLGS